MNRMSSIIKYFLLFLIRNVISFFRFFWIDINRYNKKKYLRLQKFAIDTIIDVWANTGQSIAFFSTIFKNIYIHSFEPLSSAFQLLHKKYGYKKNIRLYQKALWSIQKTSTIYECWYTPSSSLLKMSNLHKEAFPFTSKSLTTPIEINTLDDYNITGTNVLVKIDTQGYELEVIKWWKKTISQAKIVIIETSFYELYHKQPLFDNIYNTMISLWFSYVWAFDQLPNPKDWSILQQDTIFIK